MNTRHITINSKADKEGILEVAEILKRGGIVAIPTETVYGLAANALDGAAVAKIFEAKGRPQDNPLIVHISNIEMAKPLVNEFTKSAKDLSDKFWPGPLTMILERTDLVPQEVSAGLNTVAIRYPKNEVAAAIIEASGLPLAAPSANLSGSPSPTTAEHCIKDLDGRVDAIVVSGDCEVGLESTVISLCGTPRLLRPGAVTVNQLREVLGEIEIDSAVLAEPEKNKPVASPGMKYKHYAPKTKVILVESGREEYISYVNSQNHEGVYALCFAEDVMGLEVPTVCYGHSDGSGQAEGLFAALRELDEKGAKIAYAHSPSLEGVGLAVYNRLIRAAAFCTIKL